MKYILSFLFAFVLISCTVTSRRVTYLSIPEAISSAPVDIEYYEEKFGKYDGVYLFMNENIEHSGVKELGYYGGGGSWDYHYIKSRRYLVLNPNAEWLSTFSLSVSEKARLGTVYMQMTAPNGVVTHYGKNNLIKEKDKDGDIVYKFVYPNVVKGAIIEEGFEISYDATKEKPPIRYSIPLQFSIPCESIAFHFIYPEWWQFKIKKNSLQSDPKYTFERDSLHRKRTLSYFGSKIPAVESEPFSPYFKEMAQYLDFMLTKIDMGFVTYDAPETWAEHARKFAPYLINKEDFLSSKVSSVTKMIIEDSMSSLKKVETIFNFLQNTIAISNDNKDRDFANVLKEKKGSIYEITGLAHAMFKKIDFAPEYILIHSARDGYFDEFYYSFDQFAIPAIMLSVDGKSYCMFPYRKELKYDQVPEYLKGQKALVIGRNNSSNIITLPFDDSTVTKNEALFDLVIGEEGEVSVKEMAKNSGSYGMSLRDSILLLKPEEQDKFAKNMLTYSDEDVRVKSYSFENENDYTRPLQMNFEYTVENLVTLTPDEIIFRTTGLFSPSTIKRGAIDSSERHNPIQILSNIDFAKVITIHFPPEWNIKTAFTPVSYENIFGSLRVDFEKQEGLLKVTESLHLKKGTQPKEKIKELALLAGSNSTTIPPAIIFKRENP